MRFLIEKIELTNGEYWDKRIRLKLTPDNSLWGTFIKLQNQDEYTRYVANGDFFKNGYNKPLQKISSDEAELSVSYPFYLTFFIGSKKSVDDIQLVDDNENFNYVYDSNNHELSGHIFLDKEKFEELSNNILNKVFPSYIDLFVSHEYYSKYDYYVKPWTPWDLSELKSVSSHAHGNPSVPILNYGIKYDLLETDEYEIAGLKEERRERLSNYKYKNTEETINSEKLFTQISRQVGAIYLVLILILIAQAFQLFI